MAQNNFGAFGQESTFSKEPVYIGNEDTKEPNKWYQEYRKKVLNLPQQYKSKRKKRSGNSKY
jgi:hypothetical protein